MSYKKALDGELGFLAGSGNKYSIKKVADVLSEISGKIITKDEVLSLGKSAALKINYDEKDQRNDRGGYDRSFVYKPAYHRPDGGFTDYIAWIEYDDLCEFIEQYEKPSNLDGRPTQKKTRKEKNKMQVHFKLVHRTDEALKSKSKGKKVSTLDVWKALEDYDTENIILGVTDEVIEYKVSDKKKYENNHFNANNCFHVSIM